MQRFTLALTLCLALSPITTRAQDDVLWKYIASTTNKKTGERIIFYARDCCRFTDKGSDKYPKLAVKSPNSELSLVKETVVEFDCKRRASRTRIWIFTDGTEVKEENPDWEEVVPGSVEEFLLKYACRWRIKDK